MKNRRAHKKCTIQRNWQHMVRYSRRRKIKTQQKHNTICVGHRYTQTNTNNVNETQTLLQTTRGKNKPNIVYMRKS